jgi:N-acetylmuramate 1-kinase
MTEDLRYINCQQWVQDQFADETVQWQLLAADASFRRYFRIDVDGRHYVVMDAPPELEPSLPFVQIAKGWHEIGLKTPQIHAADVARGYLVLTDFGDDLYLKKLSPASADRLYTAAFHALVNIQQFPGHAEWDLPSFDRDLIRTEFARFDEWFIDKHMQLDLDASTRTMLDETLAIVEKEFLAIPQVCAHRDYHSRNLLVLPNDEVGIIDFQDAVWGPVTYDLVSLLRDCYISWPTSQVIDWVLKFKRLSEAAGTISDVSDETFIRWFDWVGVQRHIKVIGIFARKKERDGTSAYLKDLVQAMQYLKEVCANYPALYAFRDFLIRLDYKIR